MSKPESSLSHPLPVVEIHVNVVMQQLISRVAGQAEATYPVSTSRRGLGACEGSFRTPPGWHRVRERIGEGSPIGTRFRAREAVDLLPPHAWRRDDEGSDAILTRIWWLEGLEPGVNQGPGIDSFQRYIYLHGTDQEHLLGLPASIGCVRVGNEAMLALFDDYAQHEVRVWIGAAKPVRACPRLTRAS